MRRLFVAGNWKMNKTIAEAQSFVQGVVKEAPKYQNVDIAVCPPYPSLPAVSRLCQGSHLQVGAQNMHWEDSGAYTGEVSPGMLSKVCDLVIVGHSERRKYFGETDETVNRKVKAALNVGLRVILCVGETLEENEAGHTEAVVSRQLKLGLAGISGERAAHVTIAYEPVWAIGTGKAATPEGANQVHKGVIRPFLRAQFGVSRGRTIRILYGGSIKPANAAELFAMSDIDGGLVGGASLALDSFVEIIKAAAMVAIIIAESEG